ncbi:hypothetical protein C3L33_20703, partial [Rhododendron williamsianum]
MLACSRVTPTCTSGYRSRFSCRAEDQQTQNSTGLIVQNKKKKKVLVVGSGWAGLGAAYHLCKQGFDVTVLEGGYDSGLTRLASSPDDFGIRGFWYPYRNIFNLVDELGIKPFTNWIKSAQYSGEGLEVEFPIFQDLPQWPTPFGTLFYTEFARLPLVDRLTSLPLMAAVVDFDNTDTSWRKYDASKSNWSFSDIPWGLPSLDEILLFQQCEFHFVVTARELFRQFRSSERLFENVLNPLLQVGLFAPAERCSAAATLGMLYYFVLAHQKDFDLVWCRGTVREKIFEPWMDSMGNQGCKFLEGRRVTDFYFDEETGRISEVICGKESLKADAVILAVGISTLQEIIQNREEFLKVLNLSSIDLLSVKLKLDKKVNIPFASNACSGIDNSNGWTFFDLNAIYDEHKDDPETVIQADFFHANELLPLKDEDVVAKAMSCLSKCIKNFEDATVIDKEIARFPTYSRLLYMCICNSVVQCQEKSFVTGLEAANRVVDYLEEGTFARIIPVEEDEPHIQALRSLNRNLNEIIAQLPWSNYFIQ